MAVQRRRPGDGVHRASQRSPRGPANTPVDESSDELPIEDVSSRGTGRSPVRSTPVEPARSAPTSEQYQEEEDTPEEDLDADTDDLWEPDALDEQIQEELAEEFAREHTRTRTDTRRSRAGAGGLSTSGKAGRPVGRPARRGPSVAMPESGVVPPVAGEAVPQDGMHTMDGRAAVPAGDPGPDADGSLPPVPARYRRNMDPSQIYRGRNRLALIRDLAMGEWTDASIAQSIGVPYDVIVDFRMTYETEINEVRLALANQLAIESAGMWIAKRQNRISEMQEDYEDIDLVLAVMRENTKNHLKVGMDGSDSQVKGDVFDTNMLLGSRRHQNLLRSKLAILKAVSDELSPRNKDDKEEEKGNIIRYVIEQDGPTGPEDDIIGSLT